MSRDWTAAELKAASSAMMADGHMSFEEFCKSITMKHFTKKEWARICRSTPGYVGRWEPTPFNLDRVQAGELPAEYIGRRTLMCAEPGAGTVLLTEGFHFIIDD